MQSLADATPAVLVHATRGDLVETEQRGHAAIVDAEGTLLWSAGSPEAVTFMRSSAKLMQAVAAVQTGIIDRFGLQNDELAVICASHAAEPFHLEAVRSIWRKTGLTEDALGCGAHEPMNHQATVQLYRSDREPTPIHNNCSGKHTGMLASALALGQPVETYLEVTHPIQQNILGVVARFAGTRQGDIALGIDGCSAPNFAISMAAMARAFALLVDPQVGMGLSAGDVQAARAITTAVRTFPLLIGGTKRFDSDIVAAAPPHLELIAKGGAEGVECVGWRDPHSGRGMGLAIKVESGRDTIPPVILNILSTLGVLPEETLRQLQLFVRPAVHNVRRIVVGEVRAIPLPGLENLARKLSVYRSPSRQ